MSGFRQVIPVMDGSFGVVTGSSGVVTRYRVTNLSHALGVGVGCPAPAQWSSTATKSGTASAMVREGGLVRTWGADARWIQD
jgi:hypothetical protein